MTVLGIARMGQPVLTQRAEDVEDVTDPSIQTLIDDMIETMWDAGGVGLAAPQVHVLKRIFVCRVPESRRHEGEEPLEGVQVLVNPVLRPVGEAIAMRPEGCLSIPGLRGWVPRYVQISYEGMDRTGQRVSGVAGGFHANVMQHEADHLDGILYPMRMPDLSLLGFEEEAERFLTAEAVAERLAR
ncbi:peptide deformylase [Acetobacter estunensis NRIC 0472]|uniref:Peptide deformylase n=1 Tax=Acetobacter estunensis TaxID=104097 RepID=A0A967B3C7_9PROT|nr:peptide deformylase [Acetobacter estunensis]NHO52484.1 peptide deformylase [Acetobacter estunensis]GBQ26103.1 peptide deformylase [Acetobacter estunensis NRIC 0472]